MSFQDSMTMCDSYRLVILLVLIVAVFLFWGGQATHMDPTEPQLIDPTIPLVGHLLEMFWYKDEFYSRMWETLR
jgi:hypothetical protein